MFKFGKRTMEKIKIRKQKDSQRNTELFENNVKLARCKSAVMTARPKLKQERPKTFFYKQLITREEKRSLMPVEPKINFDSNKMFLRTTTAFKNKSM